MGRRRGALLSRKVRGGECEAKGLCWDRLWKREHILFQREIQRGPICSCGKIGFRGLKHSEFH